MNFMIKAVRGLSLLCGIVAAALTATAVVVVCQMVFVRFVLNQNTIWQTDFVTFSLVGATFIGAPYVLMTRGHVAVDVLPLALGARGRWWLAIVAATLSLAFTAIATVLTAMFWMEAWENRWVSESMWRVRMWIPYAAMPIGLGILTLQYVADLAELLTGRSRPFGLEAPLEDGI
ncbi:TRAP transporter small permease [Rhodoplanes roseus]|uniref:TRAP transporter small permease protein n=1 Tax=Rhodoplanes roseus TaxID=29409 RepID=A0A327KJ64_9BRAD|nr:TRAP transporter small permease [Rhodoplanes roseus]RAI38171.1 TRAP transporter permease DctQ [Rhodoplanes roseus]